MRSILVVAAALVLVAWLTTPVLEGGPLADDIYLAARIHEQQVQAQDGLAGDARRAFTHRWSGFEVFRPLTILSFAWDLRAAGDGLRGIGRSNWLLWVLVTLAFGLAARAVWRGPPWPWWALGVVCAFFGCFPAAVEALGWALAREDLFVALSMHLLIAARFGLPRQWWLLPFAMLPGLLAKESAIVLPVVLAVCELAGAPDGGGRWWWRHLPAWGTLGAYFGARLLIFGKLLGSYNGISPLQIAKDPELLLPALQGVLRSLASLIAPWSAEAARLQGVHPWWGVVTFAGLLLPPLAIVGWVLADRDCREEASVLPQRLLLAAGWVVLPLLPPCLVVQVEPDLEGSRIFASVMGGYILILALAWVALARRRPLVAGVLALLFLGASAHAMRTGTWPFLEAHRRVERLRERVAEVPAGHRLFVTNGKGMVNVPGEGPVSIEDRVASCAGAKVLTFAINDLGQPLLHPRGGVAVNALARAEWASALGAFDPETACAASLDVDPEDGRPRLRWLAEPPREGQRLQVRAGFSPEGGLRVEVAGSPRPVTVVVRDPKGFSLSVRLEDPEVSVLGPEAFLLDLGGQRVPLRASLLRQTGVPLLFVQGLAPEQGVVSAAAVVMVP